MKKILERQQAATALDKMGKIQGSDYSTRKASLEIAAKFFETGNVLEVIETAATLEYYMLNGFDKDSSLSDFDLGINFC